MAKSKRSTRTSKKAAADASLVRSQRKKEVLGLILMVSALLLLLAIVTFHPSDTPLADRFSFGTALNPGQNQAVNALGLVGAKLADLLVPSFLGYTVALFPILLGVWGYMFFRNRFPVPVYLPLVTTLTLTGTFILAALIGWFGLTLSFDALHWAGAWGTSIAGWMQQIFGAVGSFILLILTLAVLLLLLIDRDIQRSLDRLEHGLGRLKVGSSQWWATTQARRLERKAERAERIQSYRSERAASEAKQREPAKPTPPPATPQRPPAAAKPAPTPPAQTPPSPPEAPVTLHETLAARMQKEAAAPTPKEVAPAAPVAAAEPSEPEMRVQERVAEEKTRRVQRKEEVTENQPFEPPSLDLLDDASEDDVQIDYDELEENKQILLDKLETYNIQITDINAIVGPTVTLYELTPAPGVKISRITSLEDDMAMAMAARGIRLIAPIPGKSAIGVEIPNRHRELVRIRDVIGTKKFAENKMALPLVLGKSIEGEVFVVDLVKMPHLLIAGATGSGKSVGVNACVAGLLYACHPSNLKFVMIDPKKIELQMYNQLVEHYIAMPEGADEPIITDFNLALGALKSCEKEMELRYDLLSKARVRGVRDYNKKFNAGQLPPEKGHRYLPYIVVIVDELADLMMTAGKDIEGPIARLAQMARAVGIHLILATQRPSVDVITGLIKANFPARIAYQVASKIDSRTILDQNGAQGLVGNGDLLYMLGSRLVRLQGPFVSDAEVERITDFVGQQPGSGPYMLPPIEDAVLGMDGSGTGGTAEEDRDELFVEAARIIVRSQQGSVSLLQRKLSVGYSRAARIVDQLEDAGIVGPFEGSKARQVFVADETELVEVLEGEAS